MIAASTIWMSGGRIARGPPATGTCHTILICGVGCTTVLAATAGTP